MVGFSRNVCGRDFAKLLWCRVFAKLLCCRVFAKLHRKLPDNWEKWKIFPTNNQSSPLLLSDSTDQPTLYSIIGCTLGIQDRHRNVLYKCTVNNNLNNVTLKKLETITRNYRFPNYFECY